MTVVHIVVPEGIDDAERPSGGNAYDRRLTQELAATGWSVREHPVPGDWPRPDPAACAALSEVCAAISEDAVVLVDGLIASAVPQVLVPESRRLRLVVLVHMPLGQSPAADGGAPTRAPERAALSAAAAVVTTSAWTRRWLIEQYALPPGTVHVAEPGVDPAGLATGTVAGGELLCVAAVTPVKGHDVLLAGLTTVTDLSWRCSCVGSVGRAPALVDVLRQQAGERGIGDRVTFTGTRTGGELDRAYAAADLLVLTSRAETYGMVVTEALARGLPVVAAAVGGVPEALGRATDGTRPGLLVPPGDPAALGAALRDWLADAELRRRLRGAARDRRRSLPCWADTAARVARVLTRAAA